LGFPHHPRNLLKKSDAIAATIARTRPYLGVKYGEV